MPQIELEEWRLLESLEPWGEAGLDYRAASLVAQIQSSVGGASKPVKIMDIVRKYFRIQKEQTPKQKLKVAKNIAAANKRKR